ncbi:MAG: aldo/keto reductase, partial [Planctomycetota bacterium]|nr:aldo/keto reductase [Planctomycetota bacterium]
EIPLSFPLNNPDPAVVAKELIEKPDQNYSSKDLCYLLADSHEALRKGAHKILVKRDARDLIPVLHWLEIPGPPRAAEQSLKLLHDIRNDALPLVQYALRDPSHGSPGATVWGLGWVVQNRYQSLFETILECSQHIDERVRQAAAAGLSELLRNQLDTEQKMQQRLIELLTDRSQRVIKDALFGLLNNDDPKVLKAIGQLEFEDQIPNARISLIQWALRTQHNDWIELALNDPHPAVRSTIVAALDEQTALTETQRERALSDKDPWVRAAALHSESSLEALNTDSSPIVRRAASLVLSGDSGMNANQQLSIAATLAAQDDAVLRARSCAFLKASLLKTDNTESLTLLLRLSQDQDLRVRASTREILDQLPHAFPRLIELVENPGIETDIAKAAWSRLIREDKEQVGPKLSDALKEEAPAALKEHLMALSLIFSPQNIAQFKQAPKAQRERDRVVPPTIELRELGKTGLKVSPLAVSGAQQLPYSCYRHAKESGVNLFFWEPLYTELTKFLRGSQGQSSHVIAGTFHAHKEGIVKDVETALRRLKRDSIDVFLYFWARSDQRLNDEAFEIMQELKRQGKIKSCGFSTHHREMALEAIQNNPWDVLMTRHNAAHLGSEKELFPAAKKLGVGILTFSNLCYGRMLKRVESRPQLTPPSAADCYRYSLSQPGVCASISAPRRFRELEENLAILQQSTLSEDDLQRLRIFGAEVYTGNKGFNKLIRQPGMMKTLRELALAAIERDMGLPASSSEGPRPLSSDIMDQVRKDEKQQLPASLPSAVIRRGRK